VTNIVLAVHLLFTTNDIPKIVNAIYRTEGAQAATYPYGIRIGNHRYTPERAREICYTTVRNNLHRWEGSGKQEDFIDYLGDRYCPASVDFRGNINWKRNMKLILNK